MTKYYLKRVNKELEYFDSKKYINDNFCNNINNFLEYGHLLLINI